MQANLIAKTFYETMYPGLKWEALAEEGSVRLVLMKAAEKVVLAISPTASAAVDLFGGADVTSVRGWPPGFKEQFWAIYPHKIGRADAMKALDRIAKTKDRPLWDELMAGLRRYVETKPEDRPWCNPTTWLNGARWLDEEGHPVHNSARRGNGFAAIAAMGDR